MEEARVFGQDCRYLRWRRNHDCSAQEPVCLHPQAVEVVDTWYGPVRRR